MTYVCILKTVCFLLSHSVEHGGLLGKLRGKKSWIELDEAQLGLGWHFWVCQLQCATDACAAEPLVASSDIATRQMQNHKSDERSAGTQQDQITYELVLMTL